jgi:type II secretory pathway pseudopilin PulG
MTLHAGTMALITVLVSLACLAIGAGLAILVTRARMHQQRRRDKERVMTSKQIQSLMDALMSTADDYQVGCVAARQLPRDAWQCRSWQAAAAVCASIAAR